ncbi:6455_t:CDS:2 [Funneliformis mosseae]|uniref:6455_t:CDS:1 n=1 Tax=Funneliformis mosseae TaxID=27381 RepID=A0A9N8YPZ6_FUNMO|nr:6455_t:CDS:2 [Funneliformis mosseae]
MEYISITGVQILFICDSEFTYMDFEKCSTNAFKENNKENIDQIALVSAQALLNDDDENVGID